MRDAGNDPGRNVTLLKRRIMACAIGFAAVLVTGDQLLNSVDLPEIAGSVNAPRHKWRLYQCDERVPDVVFLGISYTLFGVRPAIVDREVKVLTDRRIQSLNLAAEGHTLLAEALMARRMARSGRLPRVVYFGISPDASDAAQREALARSIRSMGDATSFWMVASSERDLLGDAALASAFTSYHRWHDFRLISEKLALAAPLTYRHACRVYRPDGSLEWTGGNRRHLLGGRRAAAGDTVESTATFSGKGLDPANVHARALRDAIAELRGHGVEVRLLELPVTAAAPDAKQRNGHRAYQCFLDHLLSETGVTLVRPPRELLQDVDYFDHGHLTADGARKLSKWLSRDVADALGVAGRRASPEHRVSDNALLGDDPRS
ncbi:MAG: hypothetical protein ACYTHJ_14355 [Planctomycetota bacterium]|jgi:hypothetical protein